MTDSVIRSLRATRRRAAVVALLDRVDGFRSAQEIHEELRRVGSGVGLSTVYRTLHSLAEAGEIDVLRTATGEAAYRRCRSDGHHHHLVCRLCRRAVEIEESTVEAWAQRVATVHGYSDLDYTLEIFGNCGECVGAPPRFGSSA